MSTIENLINQFSRENLNSFFKSKSDTFTLVKEEYHSLQFEKDYFENPFFEGKINEGTNHTSLCVFSIKVKKPLSERSSKRMQFEIARKILRQELVYQGGFFVFYDNYGNFRLSFIFTDEKIVGDKLKTEFSNFRRFTYFVEPAKPNRTFRQQISTADFDDFQSILEAFSVEKVTKEFYKEIQQWYDWARQIVLFPNPYSEPNSTEKNLIRLITRLIFVWFMREKNLIPNDIFDPNTIKNLLNFADKTGSTYYKAILQNLFFATLNTEMKKDNPKSRIFVEDAKQFGYINDAHLQQGYYRYSRFIKDKQKFLALFENVPFLNGGLFESLDYKDDNGKEIRIDCFSDNPINEDKLKVPDFLFFSDYFASNRKALFEQSNGFIDILKRYNFTVDENSPIDADIALDPELLGKIFENLLAEFNPETQTTARKASGSYYTPREIVDYMVEEALIGYLEQKFIEKQPVEQTFLSVQSAPQTGMSATQSYTSSLNQKLRSLLSYDDASPGFESDEVQMLIDAIDQIKILDPACGSGAFPMGILHKLVWVLHKLDPNNEKWKEKLLERIPDPAARENLKKSLKDKSWDYIRKLGLIQNCIFGVDLQEIAVQISKLRCFISLLIEQEPDPNDKNFGIMPLPNLETKFVAANTLIGLQRENSILSSRAIDLEQKLFKIREKIFYSNSSEQKKKLRKDEKQVREELRTELENIKMPGDVAEKIASWDPFDQNSSSAWFDPEFMFGVRDGFDIVIGNPPYISTKGVDDKMKKKLEKSFGFADDTYNHFYFKGIELLRENGILSYISSKTFWTIQTKKNLRELLLNNKILQLFDTASPFENAMVDTCVAIVQKTKSENNNIITFLDGRKDLLKPDKYFIHQNVYKTCPNQVFFIPTDYNKKIYERFGKKINELLTKWWDKISTSKNIEKYKKELEQYRKSLKQGDITLLGLITEGGQGLATANNGKYIGVLEGTKWADNVRKQRPEKLLLVNEFCKKQGIHNKQQAQAYLESLSENEIRQLFDELKEKNGRDIFGQGWLYRIVSPSEIADVEKLTDDEKLNGIAGKITFVPYDKGDKEGNRWYAPTPYYIDWSTENVRILQTDPKARWQGYQFYFREGFCWSDIHTVSIKCRIKSKGIHDVKSMSLFSLNVEKFPEHYFVSLLNSTFISDFVFSFIKNTQTFQINDARQLPIIIPTPDQLKQFEEIFNRAYSIQKQRFEGKISDKEAEAKLNEIQKVLDHHVYQLYNLAE